VLNERERAQKKQSNVQAEAEYIEFIIRGEIFSMEQKRRITLPRMGKKKHLMQTRFSSSPLERATFIYFQ
jgi:hypothetical protein